VSECDGDVSECDREASIMCRPMGHYGMLRDGNKKSGTVCSSVTERLRKCVDVERGHVENLEQSINPCISLLKFISNKRLVSTDFCATLDILSLVFVCSSQTELLYASRIHSAKN
jgi:hypothetical protein